MKFYSSVNKTQSNVVWKDKTNNIIIAKNVKNDVPDNVKTCKPGKNCEFRANPIKHYRKQYITTDNTVSYSKNSLIGSLDKPGINIVTKDNNCSTYGDNNTLNMSIHILNNKGFDAELNRVACTVCNPPALVIKRATTVLDNNYSSSHREYLNKKCKTYNQNLPATNFNSNLTSFPDCDVIGNCTPYFYPSNKKFQVQGSVSSSTRIASLKYGCLQNKCCIDNKICLPKTELNNYHSQLSKLPAYKCCKETLRKSTINILK